MAQQRQRYLPVKNGVFLETLQVEGVGKTLMMLCGFRCEKDAYLMHELKDRYNELKTKRKRQSEKP